ncbi:MAG TPA: hypothetical protein VM712_14785 [Gaiellales bacterium]|nr:hypothetical protein [Gaiellales bacterium]
MEHLKQLSETIASRFERSVALLSFTIASACAAWIGPPAEQQFFAACAVIGAFATACMLMATEAARSAREETLDNLLLCRSCCEEARRHSERLTRLDRRRSLARQLEGVARDAQTCSMGLRMMFSASAVRRFGPRLNRLGRALRDPSLSIPGEAIVLTRLLLNPGRSPLTHREPDVAAAERLLSRIEEEIRTSSRTRTAA